MRLGYIVRGLLYGVIGLLALKVATGGRGQFTDTQGAIAAVSRTQWGDILLYVILAGLIGYGLLGLFRADLRPAAQGHATPRGSSSGSAMRSAGSLTCCSATRPGT